MSPYQNCLRTVEKKIEEVRNKLATETDVNTRVELESEQEGLFNHGKSAKSRFVKNDERISKKNN